MPYPDPGSRLNISFDGSSHTENAESNASSRDSQGIQLLQRGESTFDRASQIHPFSDGAAQKVTPYQDDYIEEMQMDGSEEADTRSLPSNFSEGKKIPKRNLGFVQITSLMVNSVIGSGIFTTPGYVLALTKCKSVAMALWFAGGAYTGLWLVDRVICRLQRLMCRSMLLFLEFGTALPFNGAALIYVGCGPTSLDKIIDRRHSLTKFFMCLDCLPQSSSHSTASFLLQLLEIPGRWLYIFSH